MGKKKTQGEHSGSQIAGGLTKPARTMALLQVFPKGVDDPLFQSVKGERFAKQASVFCLEFEDPDTEQ